MRSYKFLRNPGSQITKEKMSNIFLWSGQDAASALSHAFGFASTDEGANFWYEVMDWLNTDSSRKIIDCPLTSDKGLRPHEIIAEMMIIGENLTKFNPVDIYPVSKQTRRPPRLMPTITNDTKLWPDESIIRPASTKKKLSDEDWYPPVSAASVQSFHLSLASAAGGGAIPMPAPPPIYVDEPDEEDIQEVEEDDDA